MKPWIVLPYDESPVARAALSRAAQMAKRASTRRRYAGLLLATAGVDPSALDALVREAQVIAGASEPLEVRLLSAGDPIGSLHRLVASLPDAVLCAPLAPTGCAPWYAEACRLGGDSRTLILLFIDPREITRFEEVLYRAGARRASLPTTGSGVETRRAFVRWLVGAQPLPAKGTVITTRRDEM